MAEVTLMEQSGFAKALYNSIWKKFKLVVSDQDVSSCSKYRYPVNCREDVFKPVVCEQLMLRDFLTNQFFRYKPSYSLENTDCVLAFCNVMCLATTDKWDFFKRFLRYSALIAEYFLYRYSQTFDLQLHKVPGIWCTIFREHFNKTFFANGGWQGLNAYSETYIARLYIPLEVALSRMTVPYEGVHPDYIKNLPKLSLPQTDAWELLLEMYVALNCVDAHRKPERSPSLENDNSCNLPRLGAGPQPDVEEDLNDAMDRFWKHWKSQAGSVKSDGNKKCATGSTKMVTPDRCAAGVDVTRRTPKVSPGAEDQVDPVVDLEDPADPVVDLEDPADPVVDLEDPADPVADPADPDEERKVAMKPDVETSILKGSEDEAVFEDTAPLRSESPDSRSKKRSRVLETEDDIKPPSPKQLKPSE